MVPDYPSNSNKSKEERRAPDPVVSNAPAVRKKRNNKLLRTIFAQDINDIKQELVTGYIDPKIKDLAWSIIQGTIDILTNACKMMVYKDYKPVDRAKIPAERYSYSAYYSQPVGTATPRPTMSTEINYDEFVYPDFGEADAVLTEMKNLIAGQYRCATVLDLYSLSRVSTSNYTLQNYGWTNLDFAEVRQSPDLVPDPKDPTKMVRGYIIALPKAKPLR